jgi:tetratricopeptide (TPR) repeat protein
MQNRNFFLVILIPVLLLGPILFAQILPGQQPRIDLDSLRARQGQSLDRIETARRLVAQGAFISAIAMLEDIYAEQPDNRMVVSLMLTCYTELKAYPKAEMLLERELEKKPDDLLYHNRLLDIYLKTADDTLIDRQADRMIKQFSGREQLYGSIIEKLIGSGYPDKALGLIERGRTELNDRNLFLMESASIYEIRGEYHRAVLEYFRIPVGDSSLANEADRRLAALIRYPGAGPEVIRGLQDVLINDPDNLNALKYLSESYIQQNRFEDAFESTIRYDSVAGRRGMEVVNYLRRCRDRGLHEQVIKVAEYLDRYYAGGTPLSNYRFFYAEALRGVGRYNDAIGVYRGMVENSPQDRDRAEALLEIGNTFRYNLNMYDSARIFYDSASVYRYSHVILAAQMEKARLLVVEGRLDQARAAFEGLKGRRSLNDQQEYIDFMLAMIDFFRKDFDEADLKFRKIIEAYPRGYYLNDALIHSLLIREALVSDSSVLAEYAEAAYFENRLMPDSMEERLTEIVEGVVSPLTGIAYYKLSDHYFKRGDFSSAMNVIGRMEEKYPDDYFYPYCLKLKADILSRSAENKDKAIEIYTDILTRFGNYPFAGEIRKKLQKMVGYEATG